MSVTELRNIRPPRKAKDPPSKNPDSGIPRNFSPVTYNESENFGRIELQLSADSSGTLYPVDIHETISAELIETINFAQRWTLTLLLCCRASFSESSKIIHLNGCDLDPLASGI